MPKKKKDLKALVVKAQAGDSDAFAQIYDELVKPVYRYIYYKTSAEVAEDLTEDTFLKVWQNLKKYKPTKHPFSSWVYRIAHNLVIDHYRKHDSVSEIHDNFADDKEHSDPEKQTQVKLTKIRLEKVIKKLPGNYQEVIVLKYINDLTNPEIAAAIGKSEGAVRTLQSRALKELRSMLDKNVDKL